MTARSDFSASPTRYSSRGLKTFAAPPQSLSCFSTAHKDADSGFCGIFYDRRLVPFLPWWICVVVSHW